ncbi:hypothetical protein MCNS_12520 [Mycobacterium conspicuum]|uniref:Uncharacterized protein n=1 Tax=Mycobacterium conspicuum TaxID=44010 RepID=A0A7I7Y8Y9_9MYCO|nr:hypothetical protein MCNS_12520 [Mycobacterium conspicuum]BBZ48937.1 hypothetical protein MHEI_06540 [Mycobacterium heidelbergense]
MHADPVESVPEALGPTRVLVPCGVRKYYLRELPGRSQHSFIELLSAGSGSDLSEHPGAVVGVVEYVYFDVFSRRWARHNHRPNNRRGEPGNLDDADRGSGACSGSALGVCRPPAGS